MTAPTSGTTPRPWTFQVDAPDTAAEGWYIADERQSTVAAVYSQYADAALIVYAVNRIEQVEADRHALSVLLDYAQAEARHTMVQADIYLANGDLMKAHDEIAAFFAAHPKP